jgi:hypothetical protein
MLSKTSTSPDKNQSGEEATQETGHTPAQTRDKKIPGHAGDEVIEILINYLPPSLSLRGGRLTTQGHV